MKVINIGNDPKIFETESKIAKRQIEYGSFFDELHIFSRKGGYKKIELAQNVFVYPLRQLKIVKNLLKNNDCVVSTQDPFEHGLIGLWLKLWYGVPLHIQLHTDFNNKYFLFSSPLNFIRFFLAHIVLPYADNVRVVSERVKKSIEVLNQNTSVLPIYIETKTANMAEIKRKPFSILTVARLEKEKDLEMVVKVFKIVSQKFPEAVFTIAGDGSEKNKLQNLTKELGISEKVKFVGWIDDLQKLYEENEIYISTSLFEGYGMSVVEAARAGCALVLSDAGIAGEIPALISKQKDIKSFVNHLEKLFGNQKLREKMANEAKQFAQKHILPKEEYLQKYKENLSTTVLNYKPRNFFRRIINFISALFAGNKILRFIVAGGFVAITQIILLFILTENFRIWYLFSSILSFVYAVVSSFILQKFWAFRDKNMQGAWKQFLGFIAVAIIGIAVNTFSMYFWVELVGVWYVLAQIITGLIIAVINFLLYKFFIFKNR